MPPRGSHLYIIQSAVTGAVKIGRSKDVRSRLYQLQTGSPHRLKLLLMVPDRGYMERGIHQRMSSHKLRCEGEWFSESGLAELPDWIYEQLDLENVDWWQDPQYRR